MATRTKEQIEEEIGKSKRTRTTIKAQVTKLEKITVESLILEEVETRLQLLDNSFQKFNYAQETIEQLIEDSKLDSEIEHRIDLEDRIAKLIGKFQKQKNILSGTQKEHEKNNNDSNNVPTTSGINFVPYHDEETFENFYRRLETFMVLKKITDKSTKVYTLLHALTPMLHQKVYELCAPENPTDKDYNELIETLENYLQPRRSIWARQHEFGVRVQEDGETITDFATDLNKLADKCKFKCKCGKSVAEIPLSLQFIRGVKDKDIRTKILQHQNEITFKEIVQIGLSIEQSKQENSLIDKYGGHVAPVNKIYIPAKEPILTHAVRNKTPDKLRRGAGAQKRPDNAFEALRGKCYRCGNKEHRADNCQYSEEICRSCSRRGHLARVCLNRGKLGMKEIRQVEDCSEAEEENNLYPINMIKTDKSGKFEIKLDIEGKKLDMELDTGAALTSISYNDFNKLGLTNRLYRTNVELRTYTGEIIKPKGVAFVKCKYNNLDFFGKLYVLKQKVVPIFGREWLREIKLDWGEIKTVKIIKDTERLDLILEEYKDVFRSDIGCIPNYQAQLKLKDNTSPIFIKPRQVPFAIKSKVDKEIDRLETLGIITKIEHAEWGTPVVPVIKPNGNIRLCADYKVTLNKVIKDDNYPIPRIDEIFAAMNGGIYFCTLDVSNAYLHVQMEEESAMLQAISTQKGVYKVNRLMFGVKVAPTLWNRLMDKFLQGLEGVKSFFDDIIIQGATVQELLDRLKQVLQRMRDYDLRVNREKSKFCQRSIQYLGHTIDREGLHTTEEKTEALKKVKRPGNVGELRSFLGLANYYNRFIHNLATILNPLNKLLKKESKYTWTDECEKAYKKVISEITSKKILTHYNPDIAVILATDASPVGVGAVLSHRFKDGTEKPIAFASRSLTISEARYSQIDKEATAIYWGLKKFFPYLYGRKFILITDHKPLVFIFDPQRTLPSIAATRIFNYAHFLSGFDYTIEYKRTDAHANADFLSRFPFEKPKETHIDEYAKFQINQIRTLPIKMEDIRNETKNDEQIRTILIRLEEGKSLKDIGLQDGEYALQEGCVFRGTRVMIPGALRSTVLQELHEGHIGMVKMKALARSYCYWPRIDRDIEELVGGCKSCCLKKNEAGKEPYHPWESPKAPWERIHIDFAGPLNGWWYLIVVDAYTKWVEVIATKSTTSEWCTKQMKKIFSTFGIPYVLVSDNGRQFTSGHFEQFLKMNGITHKLTAPYHPATNGQAERFVQTIKRGLQAMESERGDTSEKLTRLLGQLRNAPNATGFSAYQLMFGRRIRTVLDLLVSSGIPERKCDGGKPRKEFKLGDRVQVRIYGGKDKWAFGVVIKRQGTHHYRIKIDGEDGLIWRRHIDQIRATKFTGGP